MTKQEALARARKDVCRAYLDLGFAKGRNAPKDEIDGLERKIEYLNFVMAVVEASDAEN
mgnify:FL=1